MEFNILQENYPISSRLETIRFLGVDATPSLIEIDDGNNLPVIHNAVEYNDYNKVLAIEAIGLPLTGAKKRIKIRI